MSFSVITTDGGGRRHLRHAATHLSSGSLSPGAVGQEELESGSNSSQQQRRCGGSCALPFFKHQLARRLCVYLLFRQTQLRCLTAAVTKQHNSSTSSKQRQPARGRVAQQLTVKSLASTTWTSLDRVRRRDIKLATWKTQVLAQTHPLIPDASCPVL